MKQIKVLALIVGLLILSSGLPCLCCPKDGGSLEGEITTNTSEEEGDSLSPKCFIRCEISDVPSNVRESSLDGFERRGNYSKAETALLMAARNRNSEKIKKALRASSISDEVKIKILEALCRDYREEDFSCVEVFLKNKREFKLINSSYAFHLSVRTKCPLLVSLLLSKGADRTLVKSHKTPLIEFCAHLDIFESYDEETQGKFQSKKNKVLKVLELLVKDCPKKTINFKTLGGITALISAAASHADYLLPTLIAAGSDINLTNNSNQTALHCVPTNNFYVDPKYIVKCAEILIAAGADTSAKDDRGNTAKDYAMKEKHSWDLLGIL